MCEPECPADAIVPDTDMTPELQKWLDFNTKYSEIWPNITQSIGQMADADAWNGKENKEKFLSTKPGPEE